MRQKTVIAKLLQSVTEVYYKLSQVLQSVTGCYYKVRQLLQSVTGCYYKVRQLLQSTTVITKWDIIQRLRRQRLYWSWWRGKLSDVICCCIEEVRPVTGFCFWPILLKSYKTWDCKAGNKFWWKTFSLQNFQCSWHIPFVYLYPKNCFFYSLNPILSPLLMDNSQKSH